MASGESFSHVSDLLLRYRCGDGMGRGADGIDLLKAEPVKAGSSRKQESLVDL